MQGTDVAPGSQSCDSARVLGRATSVRRALGPVAVAQGRATRAEPEERVRLTVEARTILLRSVPRSCGRWSYELICFTFSNSCECCPAPGARVTPITQTIA